MTTVSRYDPAEPLGDGRTVIEASAGTGKTFTIAALVASLVATEAVPLDRILVVTFTRAATAELKGRVRERLVLSLRALGGRPIGVSDRHVEVLTALDAEGKRRARSRLQAALSEFDRAQVFTIHGFAQRLLGQLGFRVRLSETMEPGGVDDLLLRQVASDLVVDRFLHTSGGGLLNTGDAAGLAREVLSHPDAKVVPDPDQVDGLARLRVELGTEAAAETRRRMHRSSAVTFDDGLLEIRDVLANPEFGTEAARLLRRCYDVGLVDESQDTDPIQWQIIRSIFDPIRLVVIGDPKQSIYAFRGADIDSYLSALEGADTHRTLTTNWRSDGPLVDALDTLFQDARFGGDLIGYRKVEAAHAGSRIEGIPAPLRLRSVSDELPIRTKRNGCFYVNDIRQAVASDVAAEVVRLLSSGVLVGGEPLSPADIAVLCRTGKQVDMVRQELQTRQVPSVTNRSGAVLTTPAAEEWRRFLLAVERPDRHDLVRLAASTCLIGRSLVELAGLDDDGALELQLQLREWHDTLQRGGVPALLSQLDRDTGLTERILGTVDGERLLTDLFHIAEELHSANRRGRRGSLATWLDTAMAEAAERERTAREEPESRQRRLETDADAVTVQTIHAAKGLEYPVVLVPYAWDPSFFDSAYPVFHDPAPRPPGEPRRRLIDLAGKGSPGFDQHQQIARTEEAAEEGRLLYVALTRARHHLEVWWVSNHDRAAETKLSELLTSGDRSPHVLAEASGGTIEMSELAHVPPSAAWNRPAEPPVNLEVARFERDLDVSWRRVSFSSLSADQPLAAAEERAEHELRTDEAHPEEELEAVPAPLLPLADLPAGARFGTLIHDVLEHLVFDDPDPEAAMRELLTEQMATGGWEFDPAVLVAGLSATLATPLGPAGYDPTLADLEGAGLMRELSFELPVRTGSEPVTLADIGAVMEANLSRNDPYRAYVDRLLGSQTLPFRGFMTGAIDLTGVLPNGRYVVMDYKSNALPALGAVAGPADYGPSVLAAEMVSHHYVLQATLYQVALHRYLQWRLPGYDPAAHLGGSRYLFVRGMIGPDTPVIDGARCGVTAWSPPPEMIVALSRLLAGGAT